MKDIDDKIKIKTARFILRIGYLSDFKVKNYFQHYFCYFICPDFKNWTF